VCFGRIRPLLFSFLFTPHSTPSWFSSNIIAYGLRENGTSLACSLLDLVSLHDVRIESREPWCLLRTGLGPMPFPFKPYRSTRSAQEVLARLRLKLVLGKTPPVFLWPRDRTSAKRAKSLFLLCSFGVVVLSVPCCLSFRSLSRSSGLIALLLIAVSR
jgi:hypothetical protein